MSTRTPIKRFGSYGNVVNVYGITLGGEPVARVEWRQFGERKTETFRGPKRDRENAAKAYAEGIAERLRNGEQVKKGRPTIADLWKAYLTAKGVNWRPKTKLLALQRWKVFTTTVNPLIFADLLTQETLDTWRETLLTDPTKTGAAMARNQVAHHIQLVKSVYRFARKRKLISENPIDDYTVREGRDYGALEVPEFSPADWGKILAQFSYRDARQWRPWAAIALDGMLAPRSNALLKLQWSDIDLTRRVIRWPGDTDKVGRTREQPLPRDAVKVLRICRVWARRQDYRGDFVFYGVQGRTRKTHWTYSALNAQLVDACEDAGVKRVKYQGMHSLRRMAGGNVLAATGDITKVGDWLGDTDVRVLRKSYLRQRPEHMATIAAGTSLPVADDTGNEIATAPTRGAAAKNPKR